MKLPIKVPTKIRKMVRGVKPMFLKAMLTAPKKIKPTTTNTKLVKMRRIESYAGSKSFFCSCIHSLRLFPKLTLKKYPYLRYLIQQNFLDSPAFACCLAFDQGYAGLLQRFPLRFLQTTTAAIATNTAATKDHYNYRSESLQYRLKH